MTNLFRTNERGYNEAVWKYFVKGGPRRRNWYARRRGEALGSALETRQMLAQSLSGRDNALAIDTDEGFRVFAPGTFAQVPAIVREALSIVEEKDRSVVEGDKSFLKEGFITADSLSLDSPLMQFAMRDDLLEAISAYLGVVPVLKNVDVWKSDNTPGRDRASQLYHCDWDDLTQVKIFIYAVDVDLESGPLTVLGAAASDRLKSHVGYAYNRKRYRVSDAVAQDFLGSQAEHSISGQAGTTVLADTSRCFHYGSRVLEGGRPRIVAHYQFVTPTSFLFPPEGYLGHSPYSGLADDNCGFLQRLVLGAE